MRGNGSLMSILKSSLAFLIASGPFYSFSQKSEPASDSALIYYQQGNQPQQEPDSVIYYMKIAEARLAQKPNDTLAAKIKKGLGLAYFMKAEYDKAYVYCMNALEISRKNNM